MAEDKPIVYAVDDYKAIARRLERLQAEQEDLSVYACGYCKDTGWIRVDRLAKWRNCIWCYNPNDNPMPKEY